MGPSWLAGFWASPSTHTPVSTGSGASDAGTQRVVVASDSPTALGPQTAARSDVAGTTSPTTLLAANAARVGANIVNDSTATLYVLYGSGTPSSTNFSETPLGQGDTLRTNFRGLIQGVWSAANGNARITELT